MSRRGCPKWPTSKKHKYVLLLGCFTISNLSTREYSIDNAHGRLRVIAISSRPKSLRVVDRSDAYIGCCGVTYAQVKCECPLTAPAASSFGRCSRGKSLTGACGRLQCDLTSIGRQLTICAKKKISWFTPIRASIQIRKDRAGNTEKAHIDCEAVLYCTRIIAGGQVVLVT